MTLRTHRDQVPTRPPAAPAPARKRLAAAISALLLGGALANGAAAQDFPPSIVLGTLDGTTGFRLDGTAANDRSGSSVSAAGDINGDGIADLIVGAYGADPNGNGSAGSSYVVFGRSTNTGAPFDPTLALSALDGSDGFRLDGGVAFDYSGYSVSAAGDINGDGVDDLIVGAPYAGSFSGSSYVVFGKTGSFAPTLVLSALDVSDGFRLDGAPDDRAGFSVSAAGDINGDGIDDLIIGAFAAAPGGNREAGRSYVVFGKAASFASPLALSALDGSDGFRLEGAAPYDRSGRSVSAAGDVNGDGIDDLVVGAAYADTNGSFSGSSYVVFGKTASFAPTMALSALDGSDGFRLDGPLESRSGRSVSAAGDVNGDGIADLIIGAPIPNGGFPGGSYVVFGKTASFASTMALSTLNGSDGFRIDAAVLGDNTGYSVSAAGDINGDGIDDLIIGAPRADPNSNSNAGSSYVVFGKTASFASTLALSALDGSDGFRLDGAAAGDYSGWSVSAAGDVNDDGVEDLIIGAWRADPSSNGSAGSSYVVFGGNDGPGTGLIVVSADPTLIDFGTPALSAAPITQTVTLSNVGVTSPQLDNVLIMNGPAQVGIINDACSGQALGTSAGVDDSCTFDVSFVPDQPGLFKATVIAPYNSALGPEAITVRAFPDGLFIDEFESP